MSDQRRLALAGHGDDRTGPDSGLTSPARIYDALLGGKDNYAADREAARQLEKAIPGASQAARDNRSFLGRAVRFLAGNEGVRQFLDIGTGLPTADHVHIVAEECVPGVRVVYADNDPQVVTHARALLADSPLTLVAQGDVRYPGHLMTNRAVRAHLDFSRPVAVLLVAVLHFVADDERPWDAVRAIAGCLAAGSYVVISHVTSDQIPNQSVQRAAEIYRGALVRGTARSKADIAGFFDGLDMVSPGLANVSEWRPGRISPIIGGGPVLFWAGIGKVPPGGIREPRGSAARFGGTT